MRFRHYYGMEAFPEKAEVYRRTAVRAVILQGDKLLMVHNNLGDYKFPGGGVDRGETLEDALRREVLEETGYRLTKMGEKLGETVENHKDIFDPMQYFSMTSHYYFCEVGENTGVLKLDDYECDMAFVPVWVTVAQAIHVNEMVMQRSPETFNRWVERDTDVLRELKPRSLI